ncbi:hypothetical protein [Spiroplasma citri]|uniref:hypothetical protein n=1 Tax=Spiroplasma citri TaxID=2133 RepID=UPI002479AC57|nr:hypothetical protein [Spiroplasma citri]
MDKYNPLNIENEKKYKHKVITYIKNYDKLDNLNLNNKKNNYNFSENEKLITFTRKYNEGTLWENNEFDYEGNPTFINKIKEKFMKNLKIWPKSF